MSERENIQISFSEGDFQFNIYGTRHGTYGTLRVRIDVPGYWSDSCRLTFESTGEIRINYGSGGYEKGYTAAERARNFAKALTRLAEYAETWGSTRTSFDEVWAALITVKDAQVGLSE